MEKHKEIIHCTYIASAISNLYRCFTEISALRCLENILVVRNCLIPKLSLRKLSHIWSEIVSEANQKVGILVSWGLGLVFIPIK